MRHTDKKTGTTKANKDLKQVYVLLSAMQEEKPITPVQLEVKEFYSANGGLYLTVVLTKIKESEVISKASAGIAAGTPSLFSDSEISVRDLIGNVNSRDGRFLKYVPDGFLNDAQRAVKQSALKSQAEEYAAYTIDGKGALLIEKGPNGDQKASVQEDERRKEVLRRYREAAEKLEREREKNIPRLTPEQKRELAEWNKRFPRLKMSEEEFLNR